MIYFNHAATAYHRPPEVIEAVRAAMETGGNASRGSSDAEIGAARIIYETRCRIAELLDFDFPERVIFTANATEALNMALFGIFEPGDEIISTDWEHNSVLRPLHMLEKQGIKVHYLRSDQNGSLDVSAAEKLIRKNTKAIVCSCASNVTGNIQNLREFIQLKEFYGLKLILDASQAVGAVPLSMKELQADVLCFTGHKSLMGPQGTGGMLVHPDTEIRPLIVGGSGILSYEEEQPKGYPEHLEAGTLNYHGIAGLHAAVEYVQNIGVSAIHEKECRLMREFIEEIKELPKIRLYGDYSGDRLPIVSLNVEGYDSAETADYLYMTGEIAVRPGAHCAPYMHKSLGTDRIGTVRFSFGYFNTEEEIRSAAQCLSRL